MENIKQRLSEVAHSWVHIGMITLFLFGVQPSAIETQANALTAEVVKEETKNEKQLKKETLEKFSNTVYKPSEMLTDKELINLLWAVGFEVCAQLKSDDSTKNIPVIFITALNESADETKGFSVGGADFISKPFHPEVVLARIQTHIELQAAKEKSDTLLKVLLPENVVNDLINNGKHIPEIHNNVSILFFDFVGFTNMTTQMNPQVLIEELSGIFTDFDEICSKHHATRIKTIGDAYMATTGLGTDDKNHAVNLVNTAIDFINYLNNRNQTAAYKWQCRIGVHSGSVIAGIIGKNRFAYDILGDDVNIAAKVESAGVPMKVTITEATKQLCPLLLQHVFLRCD